MQISSIFAAAAALFSLAAAQPAPGECTGQCWSHDPSLVRRDDGVYFRFETGSLIGIWKGADITGPWEYQGPAIPDTSIIDLPGRDDLWAPQVHKVGDGYILYYSVSTFGSSDSAIGYATSPTMEANTWTDHGATGVSSGSGTPYNAIDGALVRDASSGALSMVFGSFWNGINVVPMSDDGSAATGTPVNVVYNSTGAHSQEGPFIHARDGWYYLFFSHGQCCGLDTSPPAQGEEYKIYVCRSQSVTGPYVDQNGVNCLTNNGGTLVLASHDNIYGPGHCGVMTDPRGTILYYHYADRNSGVSDADYKFGWNTISWSGGWPAV